MSNLPEYFGVEKAGAIRLGKDVVADGTDVANESTLRIQSHAHSDHLKDYKHYLNHPRKLITTEGTKDILLAENRTIKRRIGGRLIVLNTDEARTIDGKKIILYDGEYHLKLRILSEFSLHYRCKINSMYKYFFKKVDRTYYMSVS